MITAIPRHCPRPWSGSRIMRTNPSRLRRSRSRPPQAPGRSTAASPTSWALPRAAGSAGYAPARPNGFSRRPTGRSSALLANRAWVRPRTCVPALAMWWARALPATGPSSQMAEASSRYRGGGRYRYPRGTGLAASNTRVMKATQSLLKLNQKGMGPRARARPPQAWV